MCIFLVTSDIEHFFHVLTGRKSQALKICQLGTLNC